MYQHIAKNQILIENTFLANNYEEKLLYVKQT